RRGGGHLGPGRQQRRGTEPGGQGPRPARGALRGPPWPRPRSKGRPMKLDGKFGEFGGSYVPEILMPALEELETGFLAAQEDPAFQTELAALLRDYAGRPTPLYRCRNLAADAG